MRMSSSCMERYLVCKCSAGSRDLYFVWTIFDHEKCGRIPHAFIWLFYISFYLFSCVGLLQCPKWVPAHSPLTSQACWMNHACLAALRIWKLRSLHMYFTWLRTAAYDIFVETPISLLSGAKLIVRIQWITQTNFNLRPLPMWNSNFCHNCS